ncbi:hypothetical protein BG000_003154, partial [Podila horticola]
KQDDEDELEVIGSGISDPYRRDKRAIPPVLPNLKYDLPETTVQNYSPGTSLVFNAYKGHASLLAQPYHAREDDDSGYRDHRMIQSPLERDHPHRPPSDHAYPRRSSDFYPDYPDENPQQNGRLPNYQPYDRSSHPMPSGSRAPTGPRYALSQVNYRMIYEYAREVHDCLIKGKVGSTDRLLYNAEILSKVFMYPNLLNLLGPRTLCNACGLIWGKMSRSKAALAKAAKQVEESKDEAHSEMPAASGSQSSSVLDDTHMSDISPTRLDTEKDPMEVSRKRARDPTPVEPEIDELEDDSSMDGDVSIKEDFAIPVEGLHIGSGTQFSSGPFHPSSAAEASVSPKTSGQASTSTPMHQRQQHLLPLEEPSDAMVLGELGQVPVTGKKLALSYLLG